MYQVYKVTLCNIKYHTYTGKAVGSQCAANDGTLWEPKCEDDQYGSGNGSECVPDDVDGTYRCACKLGWFEINRDKNCQLSK